MVIPRDEIFVLLHTDAQNVAAPLEPTSLSAVNLRTDSHLLLLKLIAIRGDDPQAQLFSKQLHGEFLMGAESSLRTNSAHHTVKGCVTD